jgi:hypothetical protein
LAGKFAMRSAVMDCAAVFVPTTAAEMAVAEIASTSSAASPFFMNAPFYLARTAVV